MVGAAKTRSVPQRSQIMVVDDAEGIRTYLKNLLSLKGYEVLLAEDGQTALAMLNDGPTPEVIILDIMMPGMDGIEVLRRVRETWPQLPVIMLSVVGHPFCINPDKRLRNLADAYDWPILDITRASRTASRDARVKQ